MLRRGLVVGKFAPLHAGHELVLRTALSRCQEVIAISYCKPEFRGCESHKRRQWLSQLFPTVRSLVVTDETLQSLGFSDAPDVPGNDAPEREHRRFVGFLCRRVLGCEVDAVFTSEDYGDGFAYELTCYFREQGVPSHAVQHIAVDRNRLRAPVSGTRLRDNLHANRQFLSPVVYASFVKRICLLGGESSGKTVLSEAAALRFHTVHVPEYGRQLWEEKSGNLDYADLLRIARAQVAREEEAALQANRYLFCDTSPLTTLFYSLHMFGAAEAELQKLANRSYDTVVLCAPDFPFVQDGTRQTAEFRETQHRWYVDQLQCRSIPYLLATGSVSQRVKQIEATLA